MTHGVTSLAFEYCTCSKNSNFYHSDLLCFFGYKIIGAFETLCEKKLMEDIHNFFGGRCTGAQYGFYDPVQLCREVLWSHS